MTTNPEAGSLHIHQDFLSMDFLVFFSSCWLIPAAGVSGHAQCLRSWNLGCPGLGFATAPVQKLGTWKYERLSFAISPLCPQEEQSFVLCFQWGNSIVRREKSVTCVFFASKPLLFRCSASFGRRDLAVYEISSLKKLVLWNFHGKLRDRKTITVL